MLVSKGEPNMPRTCPRVIPGVMAASPRETASRVRKALAVINGCRCGSTYTWLIRWVRSVMAAALLRWYLPRGFTVASAGFGPEVKPAIPDVVRLLATRGIDASNHRSRAISKELVLGADPA